MDRRSITVRGIVQGVGFRPFVHDLAHRLGLHGRVRNRGGEVQIDVEGETIGLDSFLREMTDAPPPLARIDDVSWRPVPVVGDPSFRIEPSENAPQGPIFIAPDIATCDDCLRELFDPADRRFRYPFLNCTNCGPRLTIIQGTPYDRDRTTMAGFAMCASCRSEYEDPRDRRYHAQPIACPACGPRLTMLDGNGHPVATDDPLALAVEALGQGRIVAMKSLGGYHLACDAANARVVSELRARKHRDAKPLAVMVRDLAEARVFCEVSADEQTLLTSPRRPIVLLRRRAGASISEPVAMANPYLGVMLPYTPLHHLIMDRREGQPLVMTSGNRSDDPIAYRDDEAVANLAGIADLFLTNNRAIFMRCDDSVTRVVSGVELPIRRSRGDAPQPLAMPDAFRCEPAILALGGQLKSTFALGRGRHAFLSHHLGDLDTYESLRAYGEAIAHYEALLGIRPARIVHDLHPDYASTRYALSRVASEGTPLLSVQHHRAHIASCLADNRACEPVIGVAFDGTGHGDDGAVWGGEFFVGDLHNLHRVAHLRYVGMPGGDRAVREPWRMAAAHLADAGVSPSLLEARMLHADIKIVMTMLEKRLNTPWTSSAGRLFDAVASLAGVRDRIDHEGQAAMELEWLATREAPDRSYPFELERMPVGSRGCHWWLATSASGGVERTGGEPPVAHRSPCDTQSGTGLTPGEPWVVDTRPLVRAVAEDAACGVAASRIARRFQSTMVDLITAVCDRLRRSSGIETVALSGGVFLNALLLSEAVDRLCQEGFRVYRHRQVSPGDGGLSLGQLAIAASV